MAIATIAPIAPCLAISAVTSIFATTTLFGAARCRRAGLAPLSGIKCLVQENGGADTVRPLAGSMGVPGSRRLVDPHILSRLETNTSLLCRRDTLHLGIHKGLVSSNLVLRIYIIGRTGETVNLGKSRNVTHEVICVRSSAHAGQAAS
jgi:hypothetical protein